MDKEIVGPSMKELVEDIRGEVARLLDKLGRPERMRFMSELFEDELKVKLRYLNRFIGSDSDRDALQEISRLLTKVGAEADQIYDGEKNVSPNLISEFELGLQKIFDVSIPASGKP